MSNLGTNQKPTCSDVVKIQKKAGIIINFSDKYTSTKPLFNELRILSFDEIVNLQNFLLVLDVLNNIEDICH